MTRTVPLTTLGDAQGKNFDLITIYNGTVFGSMLYLFHITSTADYTDLLYFLQRMALDKKVEAIKNMFIIPDAFIQPSYLEYHEADAGASEGANPFGWYTLAKSFEPVTFTHTFAKKTGFSDFTPKNNKCYCWPYNYLLVTNNSGATNVYKYEEFSSENCVFENQLAVTIGGSARVVPKDYKGATYNYDESLAVGKFPTCAWTSDSYTNWLTHNGVNIAAGIAATVGLVGLTIATGGAAGGAAAAAGAAAGAKALTVGKLVSGATVAAAGATASKIGQFSEAKQLPNISGGQATGDVAFASDSTTIVYRAMRCKNEYMQIIDDYFSRFGYAIRHLGTPNITGRTNWNYVEIGQAEEIGYGDVPSKFMDTINDAARKGVTIWHSHANLGNYALSNTIVT